MVKLLYIWQQKEEYIDINIVNILLKHGVNPDTPQENGDYSFTCRSTKKTYEVDRKIN